nr:hypothetical protein [Tanacetum cinerariifolium]
MAYSTIPAIYIQQFWYTICFNSSTGLYNYQLDEQWFNLHKDVLIDALDITPTNDNNPYVASPSSDTVIEYVNTLGYPSTLMNVSAKTSSVLGNQPSKAVPKKKQKLIKETPYEPSPAKRSKGGLVGKIHKPRSSLKLVDDPSAEDVPVPARPVVIREPDSGRIQPLPDVQGKGKEKRRSPMPTKASRNAESPFLDVGLALIDSEMESDNIVPKINTIDQDEGQAGPNPGNHDEGQAGLNLGVKDKGQAG